MWAFDRRATRDTWGPRFDFKKNPPNALYPENCTLLVQPVLSVDNGMQLQLRLRGYNLTHNIEFFVPRVSIHVRRALRQPPLAASLLLSLLLQTRSKSVMVSFLRVEPYWEFSYKGNPCDAKIHAGEQLI